jgi:hypothetical protein
MVSAERLGRTAYHSGPEGTDELLNVHVRKIEADAERVKRDCEVKIRIASEKEKELVTELARRGNISVEVVRENLMRGSWVLFLLSFTLAGEFVFADWTVNCFGLGKTESNLIALTIVLMSLKGVDLCVTSLRKHFRDFDNPILLVFSCMGFVCIFLMIFFSAEIRRDRQAMTYISSSTPLEEQVERSDDFFSHHSSTFVYLMVSLTAAFTIIGGVGYHTAKNRIFVYFPLRRLYRRRDRLRNEMEKLAEVMAAQNARVPGFIAEFKAGLAEERKIEKEKQVKKPAQDRLKKDLDLRRLVPLIPIFLVIVALVLFLLLRGEAKASEMYIIFLDMSGSVNVPDYMEKKTEFQKNVQAIGEFFRKCVLPGDELKVVAITECSFSRPYILLNTQISTEKGAFGQHLAREKLRLLKEWKALDLKPVAKATDILGAANLASILFPQNGSRKNIIFYGDMRQNSKDLDLETPKEIDFEKALTSLEQKGLIPELKGVRIVCLGVHSTGKTPAYWRSLREFWEGYFKKAGAEPRAFSMERRYRHEQSIRD